MSFKQICRKTQPELKLEVATEMVKAGYEPIVGDGFVYAKGDGKTPVLLTAHLDTVHKVPVQTIITDKGTVRSPEGIGGDDRCGVWIILQIIKGTKLRPSILFCEDEEIGGVGSTKFAKTEYISELEELKFLVELDRANKDDAVFYSCDNDDFTNFILEQTGYKENWGTYSDICELSPVCGVASVNLSCGYYKAHTVNEYVVTREMDNTRKVVIKLLKKAQSNDVPKYEYIESVYVGGMERWNDWFDNYGYSYTGGYWSNYYNNKTYEPTNVADGELYVMWKKGERILDETIVAESERAAWGDFFLENSDVCFGDVVDYQWLK